MKYIAPKEKEKAKENFLRGSELEAKIF